MDNKKFIGWQDRIRVDLNDTSEVEYFHSKHLQFSHQEIKEAIKIAGPFRQKIHDYLTSKTKFKPLLFNSLGVLGITTSSLLTGPKKKIKIRVKKKQ